MTTDLQVPLAHQGRGLVLTEWCELSESDSNAWIELHRHRFVAAMFSPRWGVIFQGVDNADITIHQ